MEEKKSKTKILLGTYTGFGIFTGIFFLFVLAVMIFGVIKHNDFVVYISIIALRILSFLTSFIITQAVRTKKNIGKNEQEDKKIGR